MPPMPVSAKLPPATQIEDGSGRKPAPRGRNWHVWVTNIRIWGGSIPRLARGETGQGAIASAHAARLVVGPNRRLGYRGALNATVSASRRHFRNQAQLHAMKKRPAEIEHRSTRWIWTGGDGLASPYTHVVLKKHVIVPKSSETTVVPWRGNT